MPTLPPDRYSLSAELGHLRAQAMQKEADMGELLRDFTQKKQILSTIEELVSLLKKHISQHGSLEGVSPSIAPLIETLEKQGYTFPDLSSPDGIEALKTMLEREAANLKAEADRLQKNLSFTSEYFKELWALLSSIQQMIHDIIMRIAHNIAGSK